MQIEATSFYDTDKEKNYVLLYTRELVGDEMQQAVLAHPKPCTVEETADGPVFVVWVDPSWSPPREDAH